MARLPYLDREDLSELDRDIFDDLLKKRFPHGVKILLSYRDHLLRPESSGPGHRFHMIWADMSHRINGL